MCSRHPAAGVDLSGASLAIDDCYELWDSGFISIPHDFNLSDLQPKLQALLGSGSSSGSENGSNGVEDYGSSADGSNGYGGYGDYGDHGGLNGSSAEAAPAGDYSGGYSGDYAASEYTAEDYSSDYSGQYAGGYAGSGSSSGGRGARCMGGSGAPGVGAGAAALCGRRLLHQRQQKLAAGAVLPQRRLAVPARSMRQQPAAHLRLL